jgi:TonB family protein
MKLMYAMLLALCVPASAAYAAEEAQPPVAVPVEVYKNPTPINLLPPPYPDGQLIQREEGWVILNMMVDREGKPYEATVVESTGNPMLDRAALAGVKHWRFEPAVMDGKPIDAAFSQKVTFLMPGETGARAPFVSAYKQLLKAVDAGNREQAESRLALLKPRNLYENAYAGLAYYRYYFKWGNAEQQLGAIRRALAGEQSARYLEKDAFTTAQLAALALEINTEDYARALWTWAAVRHKLDAQRRAQLQKSIDEIEALSASDEVFAVPGEITTGTSWYHALLRNKFQLEVASGAIAEIKLRCRRQYLSFRFDPKLQYTISDRGCWMEVVGDPGTKFRLIEL